ncbi:hypothetical protein P9F85_16830 [Bacillus stercoris]|uniref:hypothetical protein n=1 Tax=Bacillus stercoris TaxID=2054641 RepID=UPI002DB5CE60|nr:hypothetical protein [Bacillus stercoris]MEC2112899.1 hypothetical protein [Bacillus stercoris]
MTKRKKDHTIQIVTITFCDKWVIIGCASVKNRKTLIKDLAVGKGKRFAMGKRIKRGWSLY